MDDKNLFSGIGLLFSILVTAVITDAIKDAVGRPRPNFFWRCFPDGKDVCLRRILGLLVHVWIGDFLIQGIFN